MKPRMTLDLERFREAKRILFVVSIIVLLLNFANPCFAATTQVDALIEKLVEKSILTRQEAIKMKSEIVADEEIKTKEVVKETLPKWTQNVNLNGDLRFRTQPEWGKGIGPASQRIRNRVRARIGVKAKINDYVSGGVRFASGNSNDPRSTNLTLEDTFEKNSVWFDQIYLMLESPKYNFIDKGKLWLGKFDIPFEYTELIWDGDINTEGVGVQYKSPKFDIGGLKTNFFGNFGMLWLDEISTAETDPLLWACQGGIESEIFPAWGTNLKVAATYYDAANVKGRTLAHTASTNTLWTAQENRSEQNTLKYDYNIFEVLATLDNKSIFNLELPHGFYGDFIINTDPSNLNKGYLLGVYIGKKKLNVPGDWKVRGEWRYIERDAILDVLPDSDFVGFTTSGSASDGGTNVKGFNAALEYQLFKNTSLNFEYYWNYPIKTTNIKEPYQRLQLDVSVKF